MNEPIPATRSNPFPAAAVARLSQFDTDYVTIPTKAVTTALSYTDDYLARMMADNADVPDDTGNVIAIVGEYGTGKTHLALNILDRIREQASGSIHSVYLDAPADTFVALYRDRFIVKLSRIEVRQRVRDYYADIVADELAASELTADAAERLRAREISADIVVHNLGLMESQFMQELVRRLGVFTERAEFGTALALFVRPEFEATVWDWLAGNPPDPVLVERGITTTIDSDVAALEAMGVFAFLYGHQRHRFVLVIDELEKVLSIGSAYHPNAGTILAFKKLLEIFGKTRALLVLSGLPEFLDTLPEDARQRIGCLVRPTPLQVADAIRYIEDSQESMTGTRQLSPFNADVVRYLVELAGGNARKIIRLCYHSYQAAKIAGADVSRAIVREVAREQFELVTGENIRSEIRRVFDTNGWLFEQDCRLTDKDRSPIDFWLPIGDDSAGCSVILTSSVLHEPDAARLERLAAAMKRVAKNQARYALLVVNGHLAENLAGQISGAFERTLTYSGSRFDDELTAAMKGLRQRIENVVQENTIELLKARIDELRRQSSNTLGVLNNIQDRMVDGAALQRVLESTTGRLTTAEAPKAGHPVLNRVFERALTPIQQTNAELIEFLGADLDLASSRDKPFRRSIHNATRLDVRAAGISELLEGCLTIFRGAIIEYTTVSELTGLRLGDGTELCDLFSAVLAWLVRPPYARSVTDLREFLAQGSMARRGSNTLSGTLLSDPAEAMAVLVNDIVSFLKQSLGDDVDAATSLFRRSRRELGQSVDTMRTVLAARYAGRAAYEITRPTEDSVTIAYPALNRLFDEIWWQPVGHLIADFYNNLRRSFEVKLDHRREPAMIRDKRTFDFDIGGRDTVAVLAFLDRFVLVFRRAIGVCLGGSRPSRIELADEICHRFDMMVRELDLLTLNSVEPVRIGEQTLYAMRSMGERVHDLLRREYSI